MTSPGLAPHRVLSLRTDPAPGLTEEQDARYASGYFSLSIGNQKTLYRKFTSLVKHNVLRI